MPLDSAPVSCEPSPERSFTIGKLKGERIACFLDCSGVPGDFGPPLAADPSQHESAADVRPKPAAGLPQPGQLAGATGSRMLWGISASLNQEEQKCGYRADHVCVRGGVTR